MILSDETYEQQAALASYCRDGHLPQLDATIPDNLNQYRRLVFNIISDALETTYPISAKKIGTKDWEQLVDDFFSNYPCSSAQIWSMPYELITYLESAEHPIKTKFPWLMELLHFEWLEVEIFCDEDEEILFQKSTDVLNEKLVINPTLRLEHFTFPVHKAVELKEQSDYYLLAYRSTENDKVYFEEITGFLALIVHQIVNSELDLHDILIESGQKFGITDEQVLFKEGKMFAEKMLQKTVFLGRK
ncbi:MAG: DNA-binding domain-containing protein [Crocinitomicaceae bacterium]